MRIFTFQYVSILMIITHFNLPPCFFIYIPICFYFNIALCCDIMSKSKFTFQYVSILINWYFNYFSYTKIFTFQYVSILIISHSCINIFCHTIYIPICFYFNYDAHITPAPHCRHLHSNMFLF